MILNLYGSRMLGSVVMSYNSNQQLHAIVSGRVQGVSFRYFTQQTARRLGVTGYVLNRLDGTVEVIAQGKQHALERLLEFLHTGSPAAQVKEVNTSWEAANQSFDYFTIKYYQRTHV